MRYGLIGYGRFGALHARSIAAASGATLAAVCVPSDRSAQAAAADHPGVRLYRDHRELVADPEVDVVDVVAPNHLHAEMAVAALEAGKHVLVEKPLTPTAAEAHDLIQLAEAKQRILMVGHVFEYNASIRALKNLVDSGELGENPHVLACRAGRPVTLEIKAVESGSRTGRTCDWLIDDELTGDLVALVDLGLVDLLTVDHGAVGAAKVDDVHLAGVGNLDHRVHARDVVVLDFEVGRIELTDLDHARNLG